MGTDTMQPMEGHTVHRYDGELNHLHLLVSDMGGLVMDQVRLSLRALRERNCDTAREVITRDTEVNAIEAKADTEVVSVIARRGPVARDLRIVMSISKAIADLERAGDEAVRIADTVTVLYRDESHAIDDEILKVVDAVGELALGKLHAALEAFDELDTGKAGALLHDDIGLDAELQAGLGRLAASVSENPDALACAIGLVSIVKALERVADCAWNLAEYVVYLTTGRGPHYELR